MNRRVGLLMAIASATVLIASAPGWGEATEAPKAQTTCPVMGGKIDKGLFVEHEGLRVYLCCPGCLEKFKADPGMYIKKLQDEGVALEKLQTLCPVEGGKIDKSVFEDHEGKRVYFCCKDCVAKFKADPATYMKKLKEEGVTPEPVPVKKAEPAKQGEASRR